MRPEPLDACTLAQSTHQFQLVQCHEAGEEVAAQSKTAQELTLEGRCTFRAISFNERMSNK